MFFVSDSRVLVFSEATSALETATEQAVMQAIEGLSVFSHQVIQ